MPQVFYVILLMLVFMTSHSAESGKQPNILDAQIKEELEQQKALSGVINRIRESLDLDTIFKTTVTEVLDTPHA